MSDNFTKLKSEMEDIHFYCVNVFIGKGNVHIHAPIAGAMLNKDQCFQMASDVMFTGHAIYGDDPYWCVSAIFNTADIECVLVEHKATFTRAELLEMKNKNKQERSGQSEGGTLADLFKRMQ